MNMMTEQEAALREMLEEAREIRRGLEKATASIDVINNIIERILSDPGPVVSEDTEQLLVELKHVREDREEETGEHRVLRVDNGIRDNLGTLSDEQC